jgi:hypothetical protein
MKLTVAALAVLAISGSANAYNFKPKHANFTLAGDLTMTLQHYPLVCHVKLTGETHDGRATITGITVSSKTEGFCNDLFGANLPWKVEISGSGQPVIRRFALMGGDRCVTTEQMIAVSGSEWTFSPSGHCQVSGALKSSPKIVVKP